MISLTDDKEMLGYGLLDAYPSISHSVTTRHGGYSEGVYASFNCSPCSGDELEKVKKDQLLLFQSLPQVPKYLILPSQTHGTKVLLINKDFLETSVECRREMLDGIDVLITSGPGCRIGIPTVDCISILLYDKVHGGVVAIHAGWRRTMGYIVGHTFEKVQAAFGTEGWDVIACIGLGISIQSFEVGDEVYGAFCLDGFDMSCIFFRHLVAHEYHIDL